MDPDVLSRLLIWVTTAVLAIIAAVAVVRFGSIFSGLLAGFPKPLHLTGWAIVLGGGLIFLVGLRVVPRIEHRVAVVSLIALAAVLRVAAAVAFDPPLVRDAAAYQHLAVSISEGACCLSDRPAGFPILLGMAYRVFGTDPIVGGILNAIIGTIGVALLYATVAGAGHPRAAVLALYLGAVMPSAVLLTPVLLSETLFTTILLLVVWILVAARPSIWAFAAAGVGLALAQYVRSVAIIFLPLLAVVPLVRGLAPKVVARGLLAAAVAFLFVLAPVIAYNWSEHRTVSISTSAYGGWSLYVGTRQQFDGRNAGRGLGDEFPGASVFEMSERAGQAAIRAIINDPLGMAELAVRKVYRMWSNDDYAVALVVEAKRATRPVIDSLSFLSQAIYAFITVAAVMAMWRERRLTALTAAAALSIVAVFGFHILYEIQPRYHAPVVPFIIALAALWLARSRLITGLNPSHSQKKDP